MIIPKRDKKTGKWIKGRVRPIRLCIFCGKRERRIGRKFCSWKCMGLARRGKSTWMKGKHFTKRQLEKLRLSHLKQVAWNKGKHCPQFSGKNHWNWQGGITKLNWQIRRSLEYKNWQREILARDNFTCQDCKDKRGGNLEVHHIKDFSNLLKKYHIKTLKQALNCKELWDPNNGKTLCVPCHKKTDTYANNLRYATVRSYRNKTIS